MSIVLDGTNGISDVDGSASTPALRGTDANTGIYFPAADTVAISEGGVESARFNSSGNLQLVNSISVGNATPTTSGAGITFPATQSASTDANTLDDYEEGTWTPSIGGNATYTARDAAYTKIGNLVFVRAYIVISVKGTGSTYNVSGLPFTSASANGGYVATLAVSYWESTATNIIFAAGAVYGNGTNLDIVTTTAAAANATYNGNIFGNATRIEFAGCYRAA